jgi:hypothetical protein
MSSESESPASYPLLASLRTPDEVKRMDGESLRALAAEIRAFIIDSVTRTGGHLGAGLGVVEPHQLVAVVELELGEQSQASSGPMAPRTTASSISPICAACPTSRSWRRATRASWCR